MSNIEKTESPDIIKILLKRDFDNEEVMIDISYGEDRNGTKPMSDYGKNAGRKA